MGIGEPAGHAGCIDNPRARGSVPGCVARPDQEMQDLEQSVLVEKSLRVGSVSRHQIKWTISNRNIDFPPAVQTIWTKICSGGYPAFGIPFFHRDGWQLRSGSSCRGTLPGFPGPVIAASRHPSI